MEFGFFVVVGTAAGMAVGDLLASLAGVDVEYATVLSSHLGSLQQRILAAGVDRVSADAVLNSL